MAQFQRTERAKIRLQGGQQLEFTVAETPKGLRADELRVIS
jgi:cold shock CspA family protein